MKIVVIGGTGLIGSKLVTKLAEQGHEALAASPASGVNTITGEGLADAMEGASVVVDVSNSPSFEDAAVMEFFQTSTHNLIAAAHDAGVGHYVALSVVGTERLAESGYIRAKIAQETLIKGSSLPYSLVHATQFFEFAKAIADASTVDGTVRLPPVMFQPVAAADVSKAVGEVAVGSPLNGFIEIAGPVPFRLDEFVRRSLTARGDLRAVTSDPLARYFGAELTEGMLLPGDGVQIGETSFEEWVSKSMPASAAADAARAIGAPANRHVPMRIYTPAIDWQDDPR